MKPLRLFSLLFVLALVTSCKPTKEVVYVDRNVEVKVIETIHDTVFTTKPDSSRFTADLVVDSSGNITLNNTTTINGDKLNAPVVGIKNNKLTVDCRAEAEELFFQWKEKYESTNKSETVREPVPYPVNVEKELTWFQRTFIWLGVIFTLLLTIAAVALVVRWRVQKLAR